MERHEQLYKLVNSSLPLRPFSLVDLCCGNGSLGGLFAKHPKIERVVFVDIKKVRGLESNLSEIDIPFELHLDGIDFYNPPENAFLIALHACGDLADKVITMALRTGNPFVVVPCCYNKNSLPLMPEKIPLVVPTSRRAFYDACRVSYAMEKGYRVEEIYLDRKVTPMNTVLAGFPKYIL